VRNTSITIEQNIRDGRSGLLYQTQPSLKIVIYELLIPVLGWLAIPITLFRRRFKRYQVTNKYIRIVSGLRGNSQEIPLKNTANITVKRPILQWIVGCARITITSNAGQSIVFDWVSNYEQAEDAIHKAIENT
jgi:uncharacterized membrane protein YdbT with pleckstrin-like domain